MVSDDEDECSRYFLSDDYLDVDLLMCGHIHDAEIFNHFNNEHSLITLVTGIGRNGLNPRDKSDSHRYALYSMNLFRNSCDIIMRKSQGGQKFTHDYSIYGEKHKAQTKLQYPLKIKDSNAFIKLNAPVEAESKSLFIDSELLAALPRVVNAISSFSNCVGRLYENHIENFKQILVDAIVPSYYSDDNDMSEGDNKKLEDLERRVELHFFEEEPLNQREMDIYLSTDDAQEYFLAFLQEICDKAAEQLPKCFLDDISFRFHFRWHCVAGKDEEYRELCKGDNLPQGEKSDKMQTIYWKDSLIERAFKAGPIIFSSNRDCHNTKISWDDFITFIPPFSGYRYQARLGKNKRKAVERPILSAGISVRLISERQDKLVLYLLSYLQIDVIIAEFIDEYVRLFGIDVNKILSRLSQVQNIIQ